MSIRKFGVHKGLLKADYWLKVYNEFYLAKDSKNLFER